MRRQATAPAWRREETRIRPAATPRRRPDLSLLIAVLVLAGALGAFLFFRNRPAAARPAAIQTRTVTVRRGALERTLRLTGLTASGNAAMLRVPTLPGSRTGGGEHFHLVLQQLIQPGSVVKKGDVVAEFDRQYMLLRLDDYKANELQHVLYLRRLYAYWDIRRKSQERKISNAKARRDKARLDLRTAPVRSAIQVERYRLAVDEEEAAYRQYLTEIDHANASEHASIRRMELDLQACRLEVERAERNLARMVVRAPIGGMVVMQTITRGSDSQEIKEGDQLHPGHAFMQIMDMDSQVVDGMANQVDAEELRVGLPARVGLDAYPGVEIPARVVSVGLIASGAGFRANYVKSIPVRLKLEESDPRFLPNFSASAEIVLERCENELILPREALFQDPDPVAFVKAGDGWERRELELGMANHVAVTVREGLEEGEEAATDRPTP